MKWCFIIFSLYLQVEVSNFHFVFQEQKNCYWGLDNKDIEKNLYKKIISSIMSSTKSP